MSESASLEARVALLEGIIREARAMALAGEWDEPMIAKALGTVFECDECMDTGVDGGMPKGDENDRCCSGCARGGNPYFRDRLRIRAKARAAVAKLVAEEPPVLLTDALRRALASIPAVTPLCWHRDSFSDRVCKLEAGHVGDHFDPAVRFIDTDKEWP